MHVINANNLRDAFPAAVGLLLDHGVEEDTRIGKALVFPEPVTIRYTYPKEHVLLNPVRDANPFFHLMEAMWMLAGRDDGAFLDNYISYFSKMFATNGIVMDAYGQRWRYGLGYNQLDNIVNQLRKNPSTRQMVLQMWGAGRDDLRAYSAVPCNLVVTFRIMDRKLNMVVFNRSNDLMWGCCGANAVHFPILQEYLASRIGVDIGEYWQITTNLHLYTDHIELLQKRLNKDMINDRLDYHLLDTSVYGPKLPLIERPLVFDEELLEIMAFVDAMHHGDLQIYDGNISNTFLREVVLRMAMAHHLYKNGKMVDALDVVEAVSAPDWKQAGREWLERRNVRK
jgi:hypothetical protein